MNFPGRENRFSMEVNNSEPSSDDSTLGLGKGRSPNHRRHLADLRASQHTFMASDGSSDDSHQGASQVSPGMVSKHHISPVDPKEEPAIHHFNSLQRRRQRRYDAENVHRLQLLINQKQEQEQAAKKGEVAAKDGRPMLHSDSLSSSDEAPKFPSLGSSSSQENDEDNEDYIITEESTILKLQPSVSTEKSSLKVVVPKNLRSASLDSDTAKKRQKPPALVPDWSVNPEYMSPRRRRRNLAAISRESLLQEGQKEIVGFLRKSMTQPQIASTVITDSKLSPYDNDGFNNGFFPMSSPPVSRRGSSPRYQSGVTLRLQDSVTPSSAGELSISSAVIYQTPNYTELASSRSNLSGSSPSMSRTSNSSRSTMMQSELSSTTPSQVPDEFLLPSYSDNVTYSLVAPRVPSGGDPMSPLSSRAGSNASLVIRTSVPDITMSVRSSMISLVRTPSVDGYENVTPADFQWMNHSLPQSQTQTPIATPVATPPRRTDARREARGSLILLEKPIAASAFPGKQQSVESLRRKSQSDDADAAARWQSTEGVTRRLSQDTLCNQQVAQVPGAGQSADADCMSQFASNIALQQNNDKPCANQFALNMGPNQENEQPCANQFASNIGLQQTNDKPCANQFALSAGLQQVNDNVCTNQQSFPSNLRDSDNPSSGQVSLSGSRRNSANSTGSHPSFPSSRRDSERSSGSQNAYPGGRRDSGQGWSNSLEREKSNWQYPGSIKTNKVHSQVATVEEPTKVAQPSHAWSVGSLLGSQQDLSKCFPTSGESDNRPQTEHKALVQHVSQDGETIVWQYPEPSQSQGGVGADSATLNSGVSLEENKLKENQPEGADTLNVQPITAEFVPTACLPPPSGKFGGSNSNINNSGNLPNTSRTSKESFGQLSLLPQPDTKPDCPFNQSQNNKLNKDGVATHPAALIRRPHDPLLYRDERHPRVAEYKGVRTGIRFPDVKARIEKGRVDPALINDSDEGVDEPCCQSNAVFFYNKDQKVWQKFYYCATHKHRFEEKPDKVS